VGHFSLALNAKGGSYMRGGGEKKEVKKVNMGDALSIQE
jgi:hypothetical protein